MTRLSRKQFRQLAEANPELKALLGSSYRKWRNIPVEIDGIRFASKKEGRRYLQLKQLERAKEISHLRLQVPYVLEIDGVRICKYVADFVYKENGETIVEDVKGRRTREYLLKRRLMLALKKITIREV
jgi:hypothetical protein